MNETPLEAPATANATGVAESTVRGVGPLLLRVLVVRAAGFGSSVLLARWLMPEMFGLFTFCNFVVQSLHVLSDAGIAAALVQQSEEPEEREYRAAFTLQFSLATLFALIL